MSLRQWFGCDFGIHAYAKWQDVNTYKVRYKNPDFLAGTTGSVPYWIEAGECITQSRTCETCGIKQTREVRQ